MMRRLLIPMRVAFFAAIAMLLAVGAGVAALPTPMVSAILVDIGLGEIHVGSNAALLAFRPGLLQALASVVTPTMVDRDGFAAAGDGGAARYGYSSAACAAPDNGAQVPAASGGCWMAELPGGPADPRIWGADATGARDSTSAVQAAISAAPNGVLVPSGTFAVAPGITIPKPITFKGAGEGNTTFVVTQPTGDLFTVAGTAIAPAPGSSTTLGDFTVRSAVQRTGGSYINVQSPNVHLNQIHFDGAAVGVTFGGASTLSTGRNLTFRNTVAETVYAKSTGILFIGASEAVILDNIVADVDDTTKIPRSCIEDQGSDALIVKDVELIHCRSDFLADPPAGANVLSTQFIGGFLDTPWGTPTLPTYSLELNAVAGNIVRTSANGTWFGDAAMGQSGVVGEGIHFTVGTGSINGFFCSNCMLPFNATYGVNIASQYPTDINFTGGCAAANGTANFAGVSGVSGVDIIGVSQSLGCGAPSPVGVLIGTGSARWIVRGNDFNGVATPISGAANDQNGIITDNVGYNPVGGKALTVGTSPWTYINGPTPATLYLSGTQPTAVYTQGIALGGYLGPIEVAPGQTVQVQYAGSTAPYASVAVK